MFYRSLVAALLIFTAQTAFCFPDWTKQVVISGVIVEFNADAFTFPESWETEEIDGRGVSLDAYEVPRSIEILKQALKKYPAEVLRQNLKKIYVLKSMSFYGVGYGGTNSTDVVYITNNGIGEGYTDDYVEKTFHHEFSSILLRNYPGFFSEKEWIKNNKITYGNGGVEAIVNEQAGLEFDEELMKSGFLVQYAVSDLENDFNTYAESIFCPAQELWNYCQKYPGVNRKVNLMFQFYTKLNPEFTKAYFTSLTK